MPFMELFLAELKGLIRMGRHLSHSDIHLVYPEDAHAQVFFVRSRYAGTSNDTPFVCLYNCFEKSGAYVPAASAKHAVPC